MVRGETFFSENTSIVKQLGWWNRMAVRQLGREAPVLQLSLSVTAHLVVHPQPILQFQKGKCSLPWQLKVCSMEAVVKLAYIEKSACPHSDWSISKQALSLIGPNSTILTGWNGRALIGW